MKIRGILIVITCRKRAVSLYSPHRNLVPLYLLYLFIPPFVHAWLTVPRDPGSLLPVCIPTLPWQVYILLSFFFQLHRFSVILCTYITLFVINFPLCHSMSGKSICNKNESENSSETEGIQRSKILPTIDEDLYSLAMESTQVVADLLNWPDYDDTEIGEINNLLDG